MPRKRINPIWVDRKCERCGAEFGTKYVYLAKGGGRFCKPGCYHPSIEDRLWGRTNKNGPVPTHVPQLGNCWEFMGSRCSDGYGTIKYGDRIEGTHRVAWILTHGQPPSETPQVLHKCDNRACVRPDHLFLGDQTINALDREAKGRGGITYERYQRGTAHHEAKLTDDAVRDIRQRYPRGGVTKIALAKQYGVCKATIANVLTGRIWVHVT